MRILITIGLVLIFVDNFACSCGHVGIVKNKKSANYVFKGRVTSINEFTKQDTITGTEELFEYRQTQYRFEIIKNYKGLGDKTAIDLFQGMTDCEVKFDKGKTYIVYAYIDNRKLHYKLADQKTEPYSTTHLCTRTKKKNAFTFWETFILWLT